MDEVPFDELWKCFSSALSGMTKVYCVVDALDEMELGHDTFLAELLNLGLEVHVRRVELVLKRVELVRICRFGDGRLFVVRLERSSVPRSFF